MNIAETIKLRRSIKPDKMNGKRIDNATVSNLLAFADWAPTHANTEPWRFVVYGGDEVSVFTRLHADLYRQHTPEQAFTQLKYDNLAKLGNNVSHIVVAWMKRVPSHKIPEIEEVAAVAAAIQNVLLSATANGIASFWSTGGMTHHASMRDLFGLGDEDRVLGILYLGYSDEPFKEGRRLIPLSEKIEWKQ